MCVTTLHLPRATGKKERKFDGRGGEKEVWKIKLMEKTDGKKNYEMLRDHDTDTRFYHVNGLSLQIDIRCTRTGSVSCVRYCH